MNNVVAENLKKLRRENGYTQEQVSNYLELLKVIFLKLKMGKEILT